jgi:putative phage-type endonuclease
VALIKAAARIGTFTPGSTEWHAARATRLGASESSAVLGLSPWESKFSLWHRKAGLIPPAPETDEMAWGRHLEAPIAKRFAELHPEYQVRRTGTWVSIPRPWQLANPDRLVFSPAGPGLRERIPVEVKWSPYGEEWGESGTDEIPVYYRCQVLQQLDVLAAPYGILVALVGAEYREYRVDYDPADIEVLRCAGEEFMASLPNELNPHGDRPDIDGTGHTYHAIKQLHPQIDGSDIEIPARLARHYRMAMEIGRRAGVLEQRAKSRVLDAMGEARRAVCGGERIAIRSPGGRGSIRLAETKPPKAVGRKVRDAA